MSPTQIRPASVASIGIPQKDGEHYAVKYRCLFRKGFLRDNKNPKETRKLSSLIDQLKHVPTTVNMTVQIKKETKRTIYFQAMQTNRIYRACADVKKLNAMGNCNTHQSRSWKY